MNIFTRLYLPNDYKNLPVQWNNGIRQQFWNFIKYSGPTSTPALGNIFTEKNKIYLQRSKNFLIPLGTLVKGSTFTNDK